MRPSVRPQFVRHQWRPDPRVVGKTESSRHHADDHMRLVAYFQYFSERAGIAAKLRLPESIAQNRDVVRALVLFIRRESSSQFRWHAQNRKKISGYHRAVRLYWLRAS